MNFIDLKIIDIKDKSIIIEIWNSKGKLRR